VVGTRHYSSAGLETILKKSKDPGQENWKDVDRGDWYGLTTRQRLQAFFNNASVLKKIVK
jgi:hypothetical protein